MIRYTQRGMSHIFLSAVITVPNRATGRGNVATFEPLGRPRVHVGPELPLHRRRGRAEMRLQQLIKIAKDVT